MSSQILVLNAGSSSIKFAVFNANKPLQRTVLGMVSGIGSATAFSAHDDRGPL
jgi:acetate kinase